MKSKFYNVLTLGVACLLGLGGAAMLGTNASKEGNHIEVHASGYISKPVNEEKIKAEIDELGNVIELESTKKLQVKCFGNFEIFHDG